MSQAAQTATVTGREHWTRKGDVKLFLWEKPADPANNWRNYRYRVYENVIPLRNMLWGTRISP